jgi:hypothetical protein
MAELGTAGRYGRGSGSAAGEDWVDACVRGGE